MAKKTLMVTSSTLQLAQDKTRFSVLSLLSVESSMTWVRSMVTKVILNHPILRVTHKQVKPQELAATETEWLIQQ